MLEKLEEIKARFEEVGQLIIQPDIVGDRKKFTELSKEYGNLEKVVKKYDEYRGALDAQKHAREILEQEKDPELRELASGGKQWLARYQGEQIERTGISSLKIGFTSVFG